MNRFFRVLPLTLMLVTGLSGCNTYDQSQGNSNDDNRQLIGFSSNETGGYLEKHEGAITEMYDHLGGSEGRDYRQERDRLLEQRDEDGNPPDMTDPFHEINREHNYSRTDYNYHGHLKNPDPSDNKTYKDTPYGRLSEIITNETKQTDNVQDALSFIYANNVIIAAKLKDQHRKEETVHAIGKNVAPYISELNVKIITDDQMFHRLIDDGDEEFTRDFEKELDQLFNL